VRCFALVPLRLLRLPRLSCCFSWWLPVQSYACLYGVACRDVALAHVIFPAYLCLFRLRGSPCGSCSFFNQVRWRRPVVVVWTAVFTAAMTIPLHSLVLRNRCSHVVVPRSACELFASINWPIAAVGRLQGVHPVAIPVWFWTHDSVQSCSRACVRNWVERRDKTFRMLWSAHKP
jgi:hypothetical protein